MFHLFGYVVSEQFLTNTVDCIAKGVSGEQVEGEWDDREVTV